MRVQVKLHASLRRYAPSDAPDGNAIVELGDGATVADLVASLGIPAGYTHMVMAGDERVALDAPLRDGQTLSLFPPLAG